MKGQPIEQSGDYLSSSIREKFLIETDGTQGDPLPSVDVVLWQTLTKRQKQLGALIIAGLSDKEIGRCLGLVPGTVRVHGYRIFKRVGVHSRSQFIAKLYRIKPPHVDMITDAMTNVKLSERAA